MSSTEGDTQVTSFHDLPQEAWQPEDTSASPADGTSTVTAAASTPPESASTLGASPVTTEAGAAKRGPIPYDRHEAVLNGERKRYADLEAKWQSVSWADEFAKTGVTPQELRESREFFRGVSQDPQGFLRTWFERAKTNPQLAEMLRSYTASFATPQTPANGASNGLPKRQYYTDDNGKRVEFYTADETLAAIETIRDEIRREYAPVLENHQRTEADRQAAERKREFDAHAASRLQAEQQELRQSPEYLKFEPEFALHIRARLDSQKQNPTARPMKGLREEFTDFLLPKLGSISQTAEAAAVAKFKTQAAASGLAPSASAASTPASGDVTSFRDPSLKWT